MTLHAALAYAVAALLAATAVRAQLPLPDPVEGVIAEAEARSDRGQRWAFTRTYTRGDETIVARYDPRRAAGQEWRLITPSSEDALTRHQRGMLEDIQADSGPMADRAVMIASPDEPGQGLRHLLGDLTLVEDDPSGKRYAFQLPEEPPAGADEEHGWLTKHVDGEFAVVAADEPSAFSIRLFAPEPFGVAGAVRLTTFEDTTQYGEVEPGGPIAALRNDNHQIGRLFLVRVDDRRVTVNSDFERVEVEGEDGERSDRRITVAVALPIETQSGAKEAAMAKLVFGMNQSLDGYVDHMAFAPSPTLFRHFIEEAQKQAGSVYGRKMYDVMRYWDDDRPEWNAEEHAFATAWRNQPKWVVSRSLKAVGPNARLVGHDLERAIRELKAERNGEIEVAGPHLAQSLTELGLIDEYRIYLHPVVLGHGKPYFAGPRPPLRLTTNDRIGEDVIRLTYVPA